MKHGFSHLWPGVPLALGSAILFGLSAPLSKVLIGSVDPWLLAGLLYFGAGFGLGLIRAVQNGFGKGQSEAALQTSDLPWLAAVAIIGGMLGPVLLMLGLSQTSASSASLLLNLEGVATMVIAWTLFRENVNLHLVLGALAILAGAAMLSWNGSGFALNIGDIFVVLACLAWGIDNNLTRKLSSADPVQIAMVKGLVAGSVNLLLALALGAHLPSIGLVTTAALVGFLGIGVSLVMFMLALRHLGTARTGAYFSLAPFIGALFAVVILREPMTITLLMAGLLMAFGLALHLLEQHEHIHAHEALDHDHAHSHDAHHQHPHSGPVTEPHSHPHRHAPLQHAHRHFPDLHHRHRHD